MDWGGWWRSALVLALYAVVVHFAVGTVWPGYHVGESVPVGLAAGALVLASRAARWVCVPAVAVASTLAYSEAGADPPSPWCGAWRWRSARPPPGCC